MKCMMRADTLSWRDYGSYTEMTAPDESKRIIVHETLPQNCYANKNKSKQSIVNETLSHNYSVDMDKLLYTITEQKYKGKEVTNNVYTFNVNKYGNTKETILTCHRKSVHGH